jgi:hypothetical protein
VGCHQKQWRQQRVQGFPQLQATVAGKQMIDMIQGAAAPTPAVQRVSGAVCWRNSVLKP